MPDTPKEDSQTKTEKKAPTQAPQNVLNWDGDESYWELTGKEQCWPLTVEESGRMFEMVLQMSTYLARDSKRVRRESVVPSKLQGQELITGGGRDARNTAPILKFFDQLFISILKVKEKDPDAHRKFFDERPYLKLRWYRELLTEFTVEHELSQDEDVDILSLAQAPTRTYILKQEFYCPERDQVSILTCKHSMKKESQTDYLKFDRATGGRMNIRSREFTAVTDWDAIERLYDEMMAEVIGFRFKGEPCTDANRKKWLPLIPVDQKILAIDETFSKARSKNA
jgi:hypothetical protein